MRLLFAVLISSVLITSCANSQNQSQRQLLGGCEGCEAVFEYGDRELTPVDTLPDFDKEGVRIKVTGTIYLNDGKTPAEDVILYVYHTNQEGIYEASEDATGWAKRHGYIRGWMKTDEDGKYTFYTLKPGAYPGGSNPSHIHPIILEPNGKYYWISDYNFRDDPLLTEEERYPKSCRGGCGVLDLRKKGDLMVGTRDIILGKHVPDYE